MLFTAEAFGGICPQNEVMKPCKDCEIQCDGSAVVSTSIKTNLENMQP